MLILVSRLFWLTFFYFCAVELRIHHLENTISSKDSWGLTRLNQVELEEELLHLKGISLYNAFFIVFPYLLIAGFAKAGDPLHIGWIVPLIQYSLLVLMLFIVRMRLYRGATGRWMRPGKSALWMRVLAPERYP